MRNRTRTAIFAACLAAIPAFMTAQVQAQVIPAGQDCFTTPCGGGTIIAFGQGDIPPIPADFFGPGSDPFTGAVEFGPPTPAGFPGDTIIDRLGPADLSSGRATVPIQIVQLDLVSCQPITVTENGGQNPEFWDVEIHLDGAQGTGQMTIHKTTAQGGYFDSDLPVTPQFVFKQVNPPNLQVPLNPLILTNLEARGVPWRTDTLAGITCTPGFTPTLCSANPESFAPCCVISCHVNPNDPTGHPHCVITPDCEPCPPDPFCEPGPGDPIPAVSEWGLVVMVLALLAVGTIVLSRSRRRRAQA